jgi:hypothetical protein
MILEEINFDVVTPYSVSVVMGKRATGKSHLIINHVNQIIKLRDISKIYIIDPTEQYHNSYTDNINYGLEMTTIDSLESIMADSATDNSEKIIIIDNHVFYKVTSQFNSFIYLIRNRKNLHLTVFYTLQFCYNLIPKILSMCNYVFIGKEDILFNTTRIHNIIFPHLAMTPNEFMEFLQANTKDYNFLVLNNITGEFFSHNIKYIALINSRINT